MLPDSEIPYYVKGFNLGSDYLEYIDKRVSKREKCGVIAIKGKDMNGHEFATVKFCGKEWCPICSKYGSDHHWRKYSRWYPKAQTVDSMGYFVFTMPMEIRSRYRTQEALNGLTKRLLTGDKSKFIKGALKKYGFDRALFRWHFYSELNEGVYHPHLNVLVDGGRINSRVLRAIKRDWEKILKVKNAVIHYEYSVDIGKKIHWLKYVTRSTFCDRRWDEELADELYNFRNQRCYGDWKRDKVWKMEDKDIPEDELYSYCISRNVCPICGEKIEWSGKMDVNKLRLKGVKGEAVEFIGGYWMLGSTMKRKEEKIEV